MKPTAYLHLFLITSQLQELLRKNVVFLQVQEWESESALFEDVSAWPSKIHVALYLLLSDKKGLLA